MRFRHEVVEQALDAFVDDLDPVVHALVHRAWQLLQRTIDGYAEVDYGEESDDPDQRRAWAWEDAEMAFRARGEPTMIGPVLQLWDALRHHKGERRRLVKVLRRAFEEADAATHPDVPRRYGRGFREEPLRVLKAADLVDKPALPGWGPWMRALAQAAGVDPDEKEEQQAWREWHERARYKRRMVGTWHAHLRSVPGRRADDPSQAPPGVEERRQRRDALARAGVVLSAHDGGAPRPTR